MTHLPLWQKISQNLLCIYARSHGVEVKIFVFVMSKIKIKKCRRAGPFFLSGIISAHQRARANRQYTRFSLWNNLRLVQSVGSRTRPCTIIYSFLTCNKCLVHVMDKTCEASVFLLSYLQYQFKISTRMYNSFLVDQRKLKASFVCYFCCQLGYRSHTVSQFRKDNLFAHYIFTKHARMRYCLMENCQRFKRPPPPPKKRIVCKKKLC